MRFLGELGFRDLKVLLNTVGDVESRATYRERLRAHLLPRAAELGEDSRRRLETNPLRILDTKSPDEIALLAAAPRLEECLSEASARHFRDVLATLESCGVRGRGRRIGWCAASTTTPTPCSRSCRRASAPRTRSSAAGATTSWSRSWAGRRRPAIGFAIGLDRLIEVLPAATRERRAPEPVFYAVAVGEVAPLEVLRWRRRCARRGAP